MEIRLPAIFTQEYLDHIADVNNQYKGRGRINEIYGSLPCSILGTARPSGLLHAISPDELPAFVAKANNLGIRFNYTLNATCSGGMEFSSEGAISILAELSKLVGYGIRIFTVHSPYLIQLIARHFPKIEVVASINHCASTLSEINHLRDIGASRVMLNRHINRDFVLLKDLRKRSGVQLELLLNSCCLLFCPLHQYHNNMNSHASTGVRLDNAYSSLPYPVSYCALHKLQHLSEIVCSGWIRPEDVVHYCEIGFDSFKVDGRGMAISELLKIAEAYLKGFYAGNFLELIAFGLVRAKNQRQELTLSLDNRDLDGFIMPFTEGKISCVRCAGNNPHCLRYANKIVFDRQTLNGHIQQLERELKSFLDLGLTHAQ